MRVVYEPSIVSKLHAAFNKSYTEGKTIARFEVNPHEMNELKKWFDNQSFSIKRYADTIIRPDTLRITQFMGVPVVEHPFTYFAALPLEEESNG